MSLLRGGFCWSNFTFKEGKQTERGEVLAWIQISQQAKVPNESLAWTSDHFQPTATFPL